MIRMIENPAELAGEDITGKYILRKLNYHWFAYGKAAIVIACKGTILQLEREETVYSERWGRRAYTGTGKRYPGGICPISAVACVCDTADDVNAVIQLDVEAQDEFYQLIAKAEARVQALASSSRNGRFLEAAE
ncbi:hypothetical protein [Rhizobium leguminosarum]|uniref:Uncharacterized protein n=1 Tax=Rhizobium leguminosarum TaxID=384 RepID=A0A6P0BCT0_RHILE|nr:hypothetical protein [Rhizobium leguminosarum]MBY5441457.1 hypothetical protein [Rhizobium leguminosarum]NEI37757.1 hypothetical protein [Rhizobium leguminosarum]NEI44398.1 hypothetical protein [Rhizobium leguminosarum]